jgi:hypothetical protein
MPTSLGPFSKGRGAPIHQVQTGTQTNQENLSKQMGTKYKEKHNAKGSLESGAVL